MKRLSGTRISELAERYNGAANKAKINRLFRLQDESHKWPVSNKFNATERAIRQLRKEGGTEIWGLEYALALDAKISEIVNKAV